MGRLLAVLTALVTASGYLGIGVASADDKKHDVQIYFDATAEWAVDKPEQQVTWDRMEVKGEPPLAAMRCSCTSSEVPCGSSALVTVSATVRISLASAVHALASSQ